LYLAVLVMFGGRVTCLLAICGGLSRALRDWLIKGLSPQEAIFALLHPLVTFSAAALIYGKLPAPPAVALAAAVAAAALLQETHHAIFHAIIRHVRVYPRLLAGRSLPLYLLVLGPLGLLVAAVYRTSAASVLFLIFPFGMIYLSLKNYTTLHRE